MRQTRMHGVRWESPPGFKCQTQSTRVRNSSRGSVGPDLRQRRFTRPGSFGHGFKKLGLPHWLALARYVDFPPPWLGRMPSVLNGKGVIKGVNSRRIFHWITIDSLTGQRQIRDRPGATLARTLPYAAALYQSPSTSEFRASPGLRHLLPLSDQSHYQRHHQYDSHSA